MRESLYSFLFGPKTEIKKVRAVKNGKEQLIIINKLLIISFEEKKKGDTLKSLSLVNKDDNYLVNFYLFNREHKTSSFYSQKIEQDGVGKDNQVVCSYKSSFQLIVPGGGFDQT